MHPTLDDLLALRDGDGPADAARHVEQCERCSGAIEELRAAASALRALPASGAGPPEAVGGTGCCESAPLPPRSSRW
jgi:hypothetical protein